MGIMRRTLLAVAVFLFAGYGIAAVHEKGETVAFQSGRLRLKGLLFRPSTAGLRPVVVYLHGIGNEYGSEIDAVAAAYTDRGYVLFAPFRRGQGLSADSGPSLRDRPLDEQKRHGEASARLLQARLMETEQLDDVRAAIAYARTLPGIRKENITVAGNSFGGALAILAAARVRGIKAAVASAPAAQAWSSSPRMRELLLAAARENPCAGLRLPG
jgi:dienelactone hydrolase